MKRRKESTQKCGVQKVLYHQSCCAEGGSSCHFRRNRWAATITTNAVVKSDRLIIDAATLSRADWLAAGRALSNSAQPPPKSAHNKNPTAARTTGLGIEIPLGKNRPRIGKAAQPYTNAKANRKNPPMSSASNNARSQRLARDEASRPADNARKSELKFVITESNASFQPTPPMRNGRTSTGSTASNNVIARTP